MILFFGTFLLSVLNPPKTTRHTKLALAPVTALLQRPPVRVSSGGKKTAERWENLRNSSILTLQEAPLWYHDGAMVPHPR